MKLVITVVQETDVSDMMSALTAVGFRATQITSSGGFLRGANVTLLIGVDEADVPNVVAIVDEHSKARRQFVNPLMPMAPIPDSDLYANDSSSVRVGASIFVLGVDRFVRLTG